jgi:signal peptidase I
MNNLFRMKVIKWLAVCSLAVGLLAVLLLSRGDRRFVMGNTSCMSPTISAGERVFVKPFNPRQDTLRRYDILVFRSPLHTDTKWAMRVVGLPGEQLELGTNSLAIDGAELGETNLPSALQNKRWLTPQVLEVSVQRRWTLAPNELFVVGDNLGAANDSRFWGPLSLSNVVGVVENK